MDGIVCVGCGVSIAPTDVAVAVDFIGTAHTSVGVGFGSSGRASGVHAVGHLAIENEPLMGMVCGVHIQRLTRPRAARAAAGW